MWCDRVRSPWSGESWPGGSRGGTGVFWGEQGGISQALDDPSGMSTPRAWVLSVLYLADSPVLGTEQMLNK